MTPGAISGGFGGFGGAGGFGGFGGPGGISGGQKPDFSEIQSRKTEAFNTANTDGEDGLSLEEFDQLRSDSPFGSANGPSSEDIFAELDSDEDGILSEDEFVNRQPPGPGSNFSSDTFASLISLQEDGGSSLIETLLNSGSTEETDEADDEDAEDALISALNELTEGDNQSVSDLATQLLDVLNGEPA